MMRVKLNFWNENKLKNCEKKNKWKNHYDNELKMFTTNTKGERTKNKKNFIINYDDRKKKSAEKAGKLISNNCYIYTDSGEFF